MFLGVVPGPELVRQVYVRVAAHRADGGCATHTVHVVVTDDGHVGVAQQQGVEQAFVVEQLKSATGKRCRKYEM